MKIFLATDHAGFELKERVRHWLRERHYSVEDQGAYTFDPDDDYPDFVRLVAKLVASDPENSRGIIFGASGQGEAIVANRYRGVRAVVYYGGKHEGIITLSRVHNNANVLSLGARFVEAEEATTMIKLWLETDFPAEGRHARRIKKIDNYLPPENEF